MAEINDLNVTDASNVDRWPEGMAPSDVNDAGRADEGILARWHKDGNGSVLTTGTSTAYVYAANQTLSAYYDGLMLGVDFHTACGASPTIDVDTIGAAALVWPDGTAVADGEIPANSKGIIVHDGTNFQVLTGAGNKQADVITTRGDTIRGSSAGVAERLAVGAANQVLTADGTDAAWGSVPSATDTVVGGLETATQAEQETGTATDKIVTPGRQHYHVSAAKFWCAYDGTAAGPITPDVDYNVDNVTDTGPGDQIVNITTDFSTANFAVNVTVEANNTGGAGVPATAGTVQVYTFVTSTGAASDRAQVNVTGFGDQ